MVNDIYIGRQVLSESDDTDLSNKWKKIFHVKLLKVLLKEKTGSLSQEGLMSPVVLLMLLSRTVKPKVEQQIKTKLILES